VYFATDITRKEVDKNGMQINQKFKIPDFYSSRCYYRMLANFLNILF